MFLLLVLLASFSCGYIVETQFLTSIIFSHGYYVYGVVWASIYLAPAAVATGLAGKALLNKQNKNAVLFSMLAFCMGFSGVLTLLMVNFGMYYTLVNFSTTYWLNFYKIIEIIIALMVGWNGFSYMANRCATLAIRFKLFGISHPEYWAGKFK